MNLGDRGRVSDQEDAWGRVCRPKRLRLRMSGTRSLASATCLGGAQREDGSAAKTGAEFLPGQGPEALSRLLGEVISKRVPWDPSVNGAPQVHFCIGYVLGGAALSA